jgi:hypothetical protein
MSPASDHPVFTPPPNPNVKIWRYMDFTKYVSLLDTSSLYFARSDKLGDPFEGSTSRANLQLRPQVYEGLTPEELENMSRTGAEFAEWLRQWTFINSWHMNEQESAAMWRLYAQTNEAIAIQSTYRQLYDCLPSTAFVSQVRYIDFDTEWMDESNMFSPYVYKQKSFEHERELRAVMQPMEDMPRAINPATGESAIQVGVPNPEVGRRVEVPIDSLIEVVYVSPTTPDWFYDLVKSITAKYGLWDKPIIRSSLDKDPVY